MWNLICAVGKVIHSFYEDLFSNTGLQHLSSLYLLYCWKSTPVQRTTFWVYFLRNGLCMMGLRDLARFKGWLCSSQDRIGSSWQHFTSAPELLWVEDRYCCHVFYRLPRLDFWRPLYNLQTFEFEFSMQNNNKTLEDRAGDKGTCHQPELSLALYYPCGRREPNHAICPQSSTYIPYTYTRTHTHTSKWKKNLSRWMTTILKVDPKAGITTQI